MPAPWQEIDAWPVVAPLATIATAVLLRHLHRRQALNVPRALLAVFMCVYGAGVVASTVFPVVVGRSGSGLPWWEMLNLVPLVGTEPADMLQNVVVLLPMGFLVPLLGWGRSAGRALLGGFLLSLAIETAQVVQSQVGQGGHVGDVNDLLANCLGAVLGHGIFRLCLRVPALERLAAAATWPGTTPRTPAGAPVVDAAEGSAEG